MTTTPQPTSRPTLMRRAAIIAGATLGVLLILTIILSAWMPLFSGIFIVAFIALVVYVATTAGILYLAYRFGIDVVRQGILAADVERARHATPTE